MPSRSLIWVACAGALATFGAFFPGMMSPDSLDQLRQANAWTFSTTQPPVMTLLWAALNLVVAGPALMLSLQVAMWWGGWAMIVDRLVPARGPWQALVLLAVGFWPPLFAMTGTIWRDVHMTLALLCATGLLLRDPAVGWERTRLVVAGLLVAYASAVRVNALFSVLPLAGWVVFRAWRAWAIPLSRRASLAAGAALVLSIALAGRVANPALASQMWYPVQNLQVFDLVGVSVRTGQNLVPAAIRNGNDSVEDLASFYTAFSCFPAYYGLAKKGIIGEERLLGTTDDEVLAEIADTWRRAIIDHPAAYLSHRVAVFAANMGWEDLPLHYPYQRGAPPNDLDVTYRASWLSDRVFAAFDATLSHTSWLWRPWLYVWGSLLVLGAAALAWRRGTRSPATLLVVGSGMLYTLPYAFAAPAADLRYHHWPIAATFLGALLLTAAVGLPSPRRLFGGAAAIAGVSLLLGWAAHESRIDFGPSAVISNRAHTAVDSGRAALSKNDWLGAKVEFERAARRAPHWWVPETNLGITMRELGDPVLAKAHYDRGVALDLAGQGARRYRAKFLLDSGRYQDALDDYAALGDPATTTYETCKGATSAAARLGNARTAVAYAVRCLALDEAAFSRDIVNIAQPFFESNEASAQGLAFFQALAQVAPQHWWVHANLGLLARRLAQPELAEKGLALAAALKGTPPP